MKKYFQIFKISWQDSFVYRLNFFVWRLRTTFWILASYFFWWAVYQTRQQIGSYDQQSMFTYVLGTFLLADFVLHSASIDVGSQISRGDLSNFLVKPVNYFYYWLTTDLSRKLLNTIFVTFELFLLILILKPPLFIGDNLSNLIFTFVVIFIALILNFYFNFLISLSSFWFPEHGGWPQRFLFNILLTFFAGMYFPFDIFPKFLAQIFQILPTAFLIYFPLQIYLGKVGFGKILIGIALMIIWIFILVKVNLKVWQLGLKKYTSEGR